MEINWIHQKEIDRDKWDELVNSSSVSISVSPLFLDTFSKDWEAYIAPDFTFAIPVAVVRKAGLSKVYPPLFVKYFEPIGEISKINWREFEKSLLKRFPKGDFHFKSPVFNTIPSQKLIYQSLKKEDFQLKSLAKRMLNKFHKSGLEIREENIDTVELQNLISTILAEKHAVFSHKENNSRIFNAIKETEKAGLLYKVAVYKENVLKGGLIGIKFKNQLLYLTGTAEPSIQEFGAMYALMNRFIEFGFSHECEIDFNGSNNESIRFFNQRFGAKDVEYYYYSWDNSPFYYKFLFGIYKKLKRG